MNSASGSRKPDEPTGFGLTRILCRVVHFTPTPLLLLGQKLLPEFFGEADQEDGRRGDGDIAFQAEIVNNVLLAKWSADFSPCLLPSFLQESAFEQIHNASCHRSQSHESDVGLEHYDCQECDHGNRNTWDTYKCRGHEPDGNDNNYADHGGARTSKKRLDQLVVTNSFDIGRAAEYKNK
jgi:hypothetical protein